MFQNHKISLACCCRSSSKSTYFTTPKTSTSHYVFGVLIACMACLFTLGCVEKTQVKQSLTKKLPRNPTIDQIDFEGLLGVENGPNSQLFDWMQNSTLFIQPASNKTQLEDGDIIDLSGVEVNDNIRQFLIESSKLEWLRLGASTSSKELDWVCKLKHLRGLSVEGMKLEPTDFKKLEALKNLEWLDISRTKARSLDFSQFPNLKVLLCSAIPIDDSFFDKLPSNMALKSIFALSSDITDSGVSVLAEKTPSLQYLNLGYTSGITQDSIELFPQFKQLDFLYIGGTPIVSERLETGEHAIARIRRLCPELVVDIAD